MRKLVTATALSLVAALGLWLALMGTASASRHAPRTHSNAAATQRSAHSSKTLVVHATNTAARTDGSTNTDGTGEGSSSENASESTGETSGESSSAGETDTHEDPNGQDVNHECPPNCDTANGEQP